MFRRMVFNVLAKNRDDHAKNFSFIYTETGWHLASAYDLTYSPAGYNGEHATTINSSGLPTEADMIAVSVAICMTEKRCREIIEKCKFHVKGLC